MGIVPWEFLREIREKTKLFDVLLMGSVPLVLTAVFLLPEQIETSLYLDYQNPNIVNMFTAAYVHRGFNHFSGNLLSYLFLVVPGYLLSVFAGERRVFRYSFLSFVLVLPFVLSILNLMVVNPNTGAGFSGIDGAFLGFLPVALYLFLQNRVAESIKVDYSVTLFVVAADIIAWIYTGSSILSIGIILAAVSLLLFDIYRIGVSELKSCLRELAGSEGYFELVLFSSLLFLIIPVLMFPSDITQNNGVVNIFSHYLGLVFGFFPPYLYLTTFKYNEKS